QALERNASETRRWQAYKGDNDSAIQNLEMFARKLSVEVMVPIGRKALMPGELIHTNELLVGHYEGYFSACSAHKAQEICRHRLKLAEEQLKKLQAEADLWENNLSTPLMEGAVPSGEQVEIVEDFNEEAHNKWMSEHKDRVRRQKQEERVKRQAEAAEPGDDILRKLEDREILEELGVDPDNISEEMLRELLTADKKPEEVSASNPTPAAIIGVQESELWSKLEAQEQNENQENLGSEAEESLRSTDNLVRQLMSGGLVSSSSKTRIATEKGPQPDTIDNNKESEDQKADMDYESDDEHQVEEVQTIREQMSLLPSDERVSFLRSQIQIFTAKMRKIQKVNFISDELVHLMNVVVMLEDDLQDMIYELELEASEDERIDAETEVIDPATLPETSPKKRRISFALANEELEFRREEPVAEMLPNARKNSREVIMLDEPVKPPSSAKARKISRNKKASSDILQKVQRNIEFVKETQSVQDFDLVNQILEESTGRINTLHISFKHSEAVPATKCDQDAATPGSPADFYGLYEKDRKDANSSFPIYVNSFAGEEEVKVPIMSEAARGSAYEDPRSQFSKPDGLATETNDPESPTKSILRNKSAVEQEPHVANQQVKKGGKKNRKQKKKDRTLEDDLRDMSAYQKVMHDLVEKEPAKEEVEPEALPQGKFVDAHAPKKRVSRFKEQRNHRKT
ncbi:hypothetical protein KR009_009978, partial [Drosophila setifemur]